MKASYSLSSAETPEVEEEVWDWDIGKICAEFEISFTGKKRKRVKQRLDR